MPVAIVVGALILVIVNLCLYQVLHRDSFLSIKSLSWLYAAVGGVVAGLVGIYMDMSLPFLLIFVLVGALLNVRGYRVITTYRM